MYHLPPTTYNTPPTHARPCVIPNRVVWVRCELSPRAPQLRWAQSVRRVLGMASQNLASTQWTRSSLHAVDGEGGIRQLRWG